jgi:hypothetical protein
MARADGAGNEFADVTDAEIDAFSSRRDSVNAMQAEVARRFQGRYGRAPGQRELLSIHRTARAATPVSKAKGPNDFDQGARAWGSEWARRFGTALAGLVSHVSNMRGPGCTRAASREHAPRDARTVTRAVQVALARVQASRPTWMRAELMHQIKPSVPAEQLALDPDAAVALVNGRSIYSGPGSVRYTTRAQLTLEERLAASAEAQTATRLSRDQAAATLGAVVRGRGLSGCLCLPAFRCRGLVQTGNTTGITGSERAYACRTSSSTWIEGHTSAVTAESMSAGSCVIICLLTST